jgi:integrase
MTGTAGLRRGGSPHLSLSRRPLDSSPRADKSVSVRFHRDWLRHGLRVSEACDLRWDDIDLPKSTIIVRRLKGSTDSVHYLEKDEHKALGDLWRANAKKGIKSPYVFVNERGQPFGRMGIGRMIERGGMDTRRLQHFLGHASITNTVRYTAMSPEPFKNIRR